MAHLTSHEQFDFYEVDEIIENGINGFIGNNIQELRKYIEVLLEDHELAKSISVNARKTAIEYFGKKKIGEQWKTLLLKKGAKNVKES